MMGANGVAVADYDRDGDLDVYLVGKEAFDPDDSRTWNRLFENRGDGRFSIVTTAPELAGRASSSVASPYGYKLGAAWGDYDNDGWPDLYLTHLGPNQLLRNHGDGTFSDVTTRAGVAGGDHALSSSAVWFDYDRDGDLDLYVSNWELYTSKHGGEDNGRSNRLYRNVGNGRFDDVSDEAGVADAGATWMTVAIDVNSDGFADLYLANDFGPNTLYLNAGDATFDVATSEFGVEDPYHGMGLAVADVDGNGHFDIYLTNISQPSFPPETNPLFLNTGDGAFVNVAGDAGVSRAGWGWGTAFFDLEHDADEDLFVVTGNFVRDNPNVLYRNTSEGGTLRFEEDAAAYGVADMAPGRGLAVFDYDADGDLDLLISNVFEAVTLYENRASEGGWLQVRLEGTVSNRDALGAVVEVSAGGITQRRIHHGAQFLAQSLIPLHFGLGSAGASASVAVHWPSGRIDVLGDVELNQLIAVREGDGVVSGLGPTSTTPPESRPRSAASANYPEPFDTSTRIPIQLDRPGEVTLFVRDALGRPVDEVNAHFGSAGAHALSWRPSSTVSSGPYFYEIRASAGTVSPRSGTMVYVRP